MRRGASPGSFPPERARTDAQAPLSAGEDSGTAEAALAAADASVVFVSGCEAVAASAAQLARAAASEQGASGSSAGAPRPRKKGSRVLVAVGSPLAWARTPGGRLTSADEPRRVPLPSHRAAVDAERAVAAAHGGVLRAHVVTAGATYGAAAAEGAPLDAALALAATQAGAPLRGGGGGHIPAVHVRDLAAYVASLVACPREYASALPRFLLCVDDAVGGCAARDYADAIASAAAKADAAVTTAAAAQAAQPYSALDVALGAAGALLPPAAGAQQLQLHRELLLDLPLERTELPDASGATAGGAASRRKSKQVLKLGADVDRMLANEGNMSVSMAAELCERLHKAMRDGPLRARDVFKQYDTDKSGALERGELEEVINDLLGEQLDAGRMQAIVNVMDIDGDQRVVFEEFSAGVTECHLVCVEALNPDSVQKAFALSQLRQAVAGDAADEERAASTFAALAVPLEGEPTGADGEDAAVLAVPPANLGRLLRALVPACTSSEARLLVAMFQDWAHRTLSFAEIREIALEGAIASDIEAAKEQAAAERTAAALHWGFKEGLVANARRLLAERLATEGLVPARVLLWCAPDADGAALAARMGEALALPVASAESAHALGAQALPEGVERDEAAAAFAMRNESGVDVPAATTAALMRSLLRASGKRLLGYVADGFPASTDGIDGLLMVPKAADTTADSADGELAADADEEDLDGNDGEGFGTSAPDAAMWPTAVVIVEALPPPAPKVTETQEGDAEDAEAEAAVAEAEDGGDGEDGKDGEKEDPAAKELAMRVEDWRADWAIADEDAGVEEGARVGLLRRLEEGGARVVRLARGTDAVGDDNSVEALCVRACEAMGLTCRPPAAAGGASGVEEQAADESEAPGTAKDDAPVAKAAEAEAEAAGQPDSVLPPLPAAAAERAKPLRRWLLRSVVPTVTESLVQLAAARPGDPVEALSALLAQKAGEMRAKRQAAAMAAAQ